MSQVTRRRHKLTESVFHKLRNRARLPKLLFCSVGKLNELSDSVDRYSEWDRPKKSGGVRKIEAPSQDLKRVQSRIADLLGRIAPPDYLFNPVKGRSYVDNAARHRGARAFHLLDIADYFPSCTARRIAWFFGSKLQCSKDVTAILVRLTTRNGRLPQGSPSSPILAYLSHLDMWESIEAEVVKHACKLSVYADDITISGTHIPGELIWSVKKIIDRHGFQLKRDKEVSLIYSPADITGVIVKADSLKLPNRQHAKLHQLQIEHRLAKKGPERKKLVQRIRGRQSQKRQVEGTFL
jgi:hypothetical protein